MVLLESQVKLKAGDIAPGFELLGIDDKKHALNDYHDYKGILIIFMCNHCPYVKAKADALNELYEKFGKEIAIVGINSNDSTDYPEDSFESMQAFSEEHALNFPYLFDESQEVPKAYGAVCTPDPFLFNQEKKLVYHGRFDDALSPGEVPSTSDMADAIDAVLTGRKIENDFLYSMGCSLKWR